MCEGYRDPKLRRWVSYEELLEVEDRQLADLIEAPVKLPPPAAEPKRRSALLAR